MGTPPKSEPGKFPIRHSLPPRPFAERARDSCTLEDPPCRPAYLIAFWDGIAGVAAWGREGNSQEQRGAAPMQRVGHGALYIPQPVLPIPKVSTCHKSARVSSLSAAAEYMMHAGSNSGGPQGLT